MDPNARRRALGLALVLGASALAAACSSSSDGGASPGDGAPDGSTGVDGSPDGTLAGDGGGSDGGSGTDGAFANDSGNGDGSAAYTPKALPGLVLWLVGGTGIVLDSTNYFSRWQDQSGMGNDATVAPGAGKPDFNTSSNSARPGLGFHESEALVITDAPSLQWGTGDFMVATVATNNFNDPTPDAGGTYTYPDGNYTRCRYGEVYSKVAAGFGPGPLLIFNDWTNRTWKSVATVDGVTLLEGKYDTDLHLLVLRRKAGVVEFRRDGTVLGTMPDAGALDLSNAGTPVALGGRPSITYMAGAIFEVVAVKGATSDADLATFEGYAKQKYGL